MEGKPDVKLAPEIADAIICEKMGWTYDELQECPEEFIVALRAKWETEGKYQEKENRRLKEEMKRAKKR